MFDALMRNVSWQTLKPGLKTAWFTDAGADVAYTYGSFTARPVPFDDIMTSIMNEAMPHVGINDRKDWPNGCNINLYEHGRIGLDWHSDDEEIH
eukprot:12404370-Karenia_brevis.AAC.1